MQRPHRLTCTRLEDRTVPALFGVTWTDPQNLSVSFAPDGTDVGGAISTLNATLNTAIGKDVWQTEIRRAFQTWAAVTNLNVHVVGDFGEAFGTAAEFQGSPKQGDIRIAARALSTKTVAVANPPDLVSGWAGEIVLNTNYQFSVGGANGTYDLYSVMLHEIGHSLGLSSDFALDKSAVMYEDYVGPRVGLSAADVAAIQKLYGVREADAYEGIRGNDAIRSGTIIEFLSTLAQADNNYVGRGAVSTVVRADITTVKDADVYQVNVPRTSTSAAVALTTARVSQLAAKVTVMNRNGVALLTSTASAPGGDIWLDLKSLPRGETYYVKVEAARGDVFGVGEYRLSVGEALAVADSGLFSSTFSSGGEILESNNKSGGVSFGWVRNNADARWDAFGQSKLTSATVTQKINLVAGSNAAVLLVTVWTSGDVSPNLRVTDAAGKAVAFEVFRADGFATVIQILGAKQGNTYNFTLSSGNWQQQEWMGPVTYHFAADFRAEPVKLTTFAEGTLTGTNPTAARTFTVTQSQVFRYELTAGSVTAQPNASATLTITDSAGKVVFTLTAAAGQTLAADVFLNPGTYTVKITASTTSGTLQPLSILGRLAALTDPIGPSLLDPTAPLDAPAATTSTTTDASGEETVPTATEPKTEDPGFFWGASLVDPLKLWW